MKKNIFMAYNLYDTASLPMGT